MAEKLFKFFENDLLFSLVSIIAALLAGVLLYVLIMVVLKRWTKSFILKKFKLPLIYIKKPLYLLMLAISVLVVTPALRFPIDAQYIISKITTLWLIASIGWFLIGILHTSREILLSQHDIKTEDNLKARRIYTQIGVIESVIAVIIVVLTVSSMLMTFEKVRQIGTSIFASAGVLGIILGFAAQKTLGNIIAGIQIALAQPIRLDDVVIVENEWGWIEEITLTYVVVRIWDLRRLVLPISYFVEKPFQNWTRTSATILGSVYIYADYTIPVEAVRAELTRIVEKNPLWDKQVNSLQVTNATERTIELRALISAANSPTAWKLRCEIREKLLEFLQRKFPGSLPRTRVELQKTEDNNKS
jgi:small-conductance mechanosensitive channel